MLFIFSFLAGDAIADTPPANSLDSNVIVIEVTGTVPGFTQPQLVSYLSNRMQEEIATPWHG
jgi:hypothetical protein